MRIGNRLWCGESQVCQLKSASASGQLYAVDLATVVLLAVS